MRLHVACGLQSGDLLLQALCLLGGRRLWAACAALQLGRQQKLQPLSDLLCARPVQVLGQQIAQHRRSLWEGLDQGDHLIGRLLAPGGETGPRLHRQVVLADGQVEHRLQRLGAAALPVHRHR